MSSDMYLNQLSQLQQKKAWLEEDLAKQRNDSAKSQKISSNILSYLSKTRSETARKRRQRLWQSEQDKIAKIQKKIADLEQKLANNNKAINQKQKQVADLQLSNLQRANLREANLQDANLAYAQMQEADLGLANLQQVGLQYANLQGAYLGAADLREANLEQTRFQGVDLGQANLRDAKKVETARFDEKTLLPDAKWQRDDDGNVIEDDEGKWLYTPQSYWIPETDMTRYTNPDHPDFWTPKWAVAGFASASEWHNTGRKLLPARWLPGRSYPWSDAGYGDDHMAWLRDGNHDYQAQYTVAGFKSHWEWRDAGYRDWKYAGDLTPWREAGYGNDHMAWVRDGKPDPLTKDDPYYEYRYEWLAAGFTSQNEWLRADIPQPWREAGYGKNGFMAWVRDGKPDPLPIDHPDSWRPEWQIAGFGLDEWFNAGRPQLWREAGYGKNGFMAWVRDGKPDKKPKEK